MIKKSEVNEIHTKKYCLIIFCHIKKVRRMYARVRAYMRVSVWRYVYV
jgi:hypothetical protein